MGARRIVALLALAVIVTATFTRDDVFKDVRSGREMHLEVRMSSVLAKQAGSWKIRALKKPS